MMLNVGAVQMAMSGRRDDDIAKAMRLVREAAAMGTPSVVVRGCATAEPIIDRQNGFLCDDTMQSLCDVLNMTLSDRAMTKQVGKSARKTIYLSWGDIASSTVERYQALIERNTKSPKIL